MRSDGKWKRFQKMYQLNPRRFEHTEEMQTFADLLYTAIYVELYISFIAKRCQKDAHSDTKTKIIVVQFSSSFRVEKFIAKYYSNCNYLNI